jgi:hypothetical protein
MYWNYLLPHIQGDSLTMIKDDTRKQISLFDLPDQKDELATETVPVSTVDMQEVIAKKGERLAKQRADPGKDTGKPTSRQAKRQEATRPAPRGQLPKVMPGAVPDGDVRLTANIRQDLHLKLKIAAATRRTTIGELLENLVEQYL